MKGKARQLAPINNNNKHTITINPSTTPNMVQIPPKYPAAGGHSLFTRPGTRAAAADTSLFKTYQKKDNIEIIDNHSLETTINERSQCSTKALTIVTSPQMDESFKFRRISNQMLLNLTSTKKKIV